MRLTATLTTLVVLVLLAFLAGQPAANEPDPILKSFERELNHEPSPVPTARRDSIDTDELYRIVNSAHWSRSGEHTTESNETTARGTEDEVKTDD